MTREIFRWFAFATIASTLVSLTFLFIYRKRQPRQNLILGILLFISLTFSVITWTLMYNKIPTTPFNNLYTFFSFPAIMWFYHETLTKRSLRITVRIFTIAFLVLAVIFALDQGLNVINHHTWTLSSILITTTSFFFVADLNLMDESKFSKNPFHETNIILNTSLALYYFATIVVFAATEYVFSNLSYEDIRLFWSFHNGLHVLKDIGITIAFYRSAKTQGGSLRLTTKSNPEA